MNTLENDKSGFRRNQRNLESAKLEKENIWLLCSGIKIIWIMGHGLDNRFKITPQTKRVLKIEIQ